MEELNKEHNTGIVIENTANSTVENNHVTQDPEPAFSDEEEDSPLRLSTHYVSHSILAYFESCAWIGDIVNLINFTIFQNSDERGRRGGRGGHAIICDKIEKRAEKRELRREEGGHRVAIKSHIRTGRTEKQHRDYAHGDG